MGPAGQSHVCRTYNTVAPGVCGELHELAVGDRWMDPLPNHHDRDLPNHRATTATGSGSASSSLEGRELMK